MDINNSENSGRELKVLDLDMADSEHGALTSDRVLEVFDPPMCCSTGVCGPSVDSALIQFAQNVEWLKRRGIGVTRYNLSQQPGAFVKNPEVSRLLHIEGNDCLPITLLNGKVVATRLYPVRDELTRILGMR